MLPSHAPLRCEGNGSIPAEQVVAAGTRVLETEMRLGFFDQHADDYPFNNASAALAWDLLDGPAHRALAAEAAAKSTVLLKNKGGFLPFGPSGIRSIAVIGPFARCDRGLCYAYNDVGIILAHFSSLDCTEAVTTKPHRVAHTALLDTLVLIGIIWRCCVEIGASSGTTTPAPRRTLSTLWTGSRPPRKGPASRSRTLPGRTPPAAPAAFRPAGRAGARGLRVTQAPSQRRPP